MTARRIQVAVVDGAMTILGLALLCLGIWAVWKENLGLAGTALAGGLVLLFAATIHRFESLKGLGMEAKTRQLDATIDKAELALGQLKTLTELVGANLIKLSSSSGRLSGPPSIMEGYELSRRVDRMLQSIGSTAEARKEALLPWARSAAVDLYYAARHPVFLDLRRAERELSQESGKGDAEARAQIFARIRAIQSFGQELGQGTKTWALDEFAPNLLRFVDEAPGISDARRAEARRACADASAQLQYLARTLDFQDVAYWAAVKRASEQEQI